MTDHTRALQRLVDQTVCRGQAGVLYLDLIDPHEIIVTAPIKVPPNTGFVVRGSTMRLPKIVWRGDSTGALFDCPHSRETVFENFAVEVQGPLGAVFRYYRESVTPGAIVPTNNTRRQIYIESAVNPSDNRPYLTYGVHYALGVNANNDCGRDDNVQISYPADAGWFFEGNQSKEHILTQCKINGWPGVTESGVTGSGSWMMQGGGGNNLEVAIRPTNTTDALLHIGTRWENCKRLFESSGPTTDPQPVEFHGGQFESDVLAADGYAMLVKTPGPIWVQGMILQVPGNPVFRARCEGFIPTDIHFVKCEFGAHGSWEDRGNLVTGSHTYGPEALLGGTHRDAAGFVVSMGVHAT